MPKTVLITGSTVGIGKATAFSLAELGWTVLIHGRKESVCKEIIQEIKEKTKNNSIDYFIADLTNLKKVNDMADEIINQYPGLSVIINNAGTFSNTRKMTNEGLEQTFVVNYLSRFLLVQKLIPIIRQNNPARIIDISGAYHSKGSIHFDDLTLEKNYSLSEANNQSKLANVLFTYKLAKELQTHGITSNTIHPGAVNTGSILKSEEFSDLVKFLYRISSVFFKHPHQAAEAIVYLATSEKLNGVTSHYFEGKKQTRSSSLSYDEALQDKLWDFSLNWLKSHDYL